MARSSDRPSLALHPGWPVVLAMVAVVACFAATVMFSQLRLRPISDHAIEILGNDSPGVHELSTIEGDLLRLGVVVNENVDRAATGLPPRSDGIAELRHGIDAALVAYQALPTTPEERDRIDAIAGDLALLDESMRAVQGDLGTASYEHANGELRREFHPRLQQTADDVERLRELDFTYVAQHTANILAARQEATGIVRILGATSVLIAIIATLLVVRVLRARARLLEERDRLLAARATELEAFAGRVAHDLRNPLSLIGLRVLTVLEREDLAAPARDNLGKAARQVERMAQIIDGMLEFARAGANPAPGARANLADVVGDVVADLRPALDASHAELEVAAVEPIELACTDAALASVLSNLLGNALKYGHVDAEPARIAVSVQRLDGAARVEIADRGPGLTADAARCVFEPFRQFDTGRGGIGLGLATVKKLVEAYHGHVGVRSSPGDGATFWFEVPYAA